MNYTEKVLDHFQHPRNVGSLPDADGTGTVGSPVCGDMMTFTIKVRDGRLADIKFRTFGCGAAIAVSSMISELAMGKTLAEALAITNEQVAAELGGLPPHKMHCSNLGADALHAAIRDYQVRPAGTPAPPAPAPDLPRQEGCACPYCAGPVDEGERKFCRACLVQLGECPACGAITNLEGETCVGCGAALRESGAGAGG